ncbi:hypothetical protein C2G38_2163303 [Gigaspora rosea]|uniref:Uncharacterized protein n=1 Tax=Gigaspora rosea TaxID=44941 RepID=A0A397VV88_9GLOM|nr:hypothetical protein C2G38_2163303 [Gigaspora rosea]
MLFKNIYLKSLGFLLDKDNDNIIFTIQVIDEIEMIYEEDLKHWAQFYQKPYIIASLNPNISKVSNNDLYDGT